MATPWTLPVLLPEPLPRRSVHYAVPAGVSSASAEEVLRFVADEVGCPRDWLRLSANYSSSGAFERGHLARVEWALQGLLGGKGGFGAGLRAMGKTAAARQKPSNDFSLCRDLQGNRLGAINTLLMIERATAESSRGEEPDLEKDEWLLERPTWLEPEKRGDKQKRHNTEQKRAPAAAGAAAKATVKTNENTAFQLSFSRELEESEDIALDAVQEGLLRKRTKLSENREEIAQLKEAELPSGVTLVSGKALVDSRITHTSSSSSKGHVTVTGLSDFATVSFSKDIFPVDNVKCTLLTDGLIQVGFADSQSLTDDMEKNLDGVGDVDGSYSYDYVRNILWTNGTSTLVGNDSEAGVESKSQRLSVVHCSLNSSNRLIEFRVNDRDIVPVEVNKDKTIDLDFALSLEKDESIDIQFLYQSTPSTNSAIPDKKQVEEKVSVESLVALGGDKLKEELRKLGLKYGGTIEERAKRLYLARTLPREDWPQSLFPK